MIAAPSSSPSWVVRLPSRVAGEWTWVGSVLGSPREALHVSSAHPFASEHEARAARDRWVRDLAYTAPELVGTLPARLRAAIFEVYPSDPTTTGVQPDGAGCAGATSTGRPGPVPGGEGAGEVVAGPVGPVEHTTAPRGRPEGEGAWTCPAVPDGATPSPSPEAFPGLCRPDDLLAWEGREQPAPAGPSAVLQTAEGVSGTLDRARFEGLRWRVVAVGAATLGRGPRWAAVGQITGLGPEAARRLCWGAGFDPEEIVGAEEEEER